MQSPFGKNCSLGYIYYADIITAIRSLFLCFLFGFVLSVFTNKDANRSSLQKIGRYDKQNYPQIIQKTIYNTRYGLHKVRGRKKTIKNKKGINKAKNE